MTKQKIITLVLILISAIGTSLLTAESLDNLPDTVFTKSYVERVNR